MKRTMTPGPMASAASVEGAKAPTASPSEVDANDSSVRMPQNLANLPSQHKHYPQSAPQMGMGGMGIVAPDQLGTTWTPLSSCAGPVR